MPLQPQTIPINFTGLDQKFDERQLEPGKLARADNVEMLETGKLTRRRGYTRVVMQRTVDDQALDVFHVIYHRVGMLGQRIVVFGHDRLLALGERTSTLASFAATTSSLIDHGPVPRCSIAAFHVTTAGVEQQVIGG